MNRVLVALLVGCAPTATPVPEPAPPVVDPHAAAEAQAEENLATFDDLDFNVFSGQKWDELSRSHAPDIVVHWPDGRTTTGIDPHVADLKSMFVYAPDTNIKEHPLKVAHGNMTAVTGIMRGTFSQPMPTP